MSASSDPTTPGTRATPTALGAAVTTAVTGTPIAVVFVWLLESYGTVHGQPIKLDSETASAVGAIGASAMGYLSQVLQALYALAQEWLTRPPTH